MTTAPLYRNVVILAICQGLFICGQTAVFFIGALIGFELADDKSLATLPVTMVILGTACATIPASLYMGKVGRRFGFMSGAAIGMAGAGIALYGLDIASFWVFCFGTFFIGIYNAFCQYYRFAVADAAPEAIRAKAISWVLAGGVIAGVFGPQIVLWTKHLFADVLYMGSYAAILVMILLAFGLVNFLRIPPLSQEEQQEKTRPLSQIVMSRRFVTAALTSMIAYGTMSLMMTATPLAMVGYHFLDSDAAFVIQWHVLGMFAPSFVTGWLINKFGLYRIMFIGAVIAFGAPVVALAGKEFVNFWIALTMIGLGWNFMFISGTTLLTQVHSLAERAKTQAANDFLVFAATATSSFVSGSILYAYDWEAVSYIVIPLTVIPMFLVIWSVMSEKREHKQSYTSIN